MNATYHTMPSIVDRLLKEGYLFDFFQATRLLEHVVDDRLASSGQAGTEADRVRIRPHTGLAFPATDIRSIEIPDETPRRAIVTVTFMGLYGVDSPLPVYFYDSIATEAEQTKPLRDFLDIFNHRLYTLFYRSWKKYRPALHYVPAKLDTYSQRALCLAGLGTKNAAVQPYVPSLRFAALAGHLLSRARNAASLRCLLMDFFEGIGVAIQENVPRWVPIPQRMHMGKGPFRMILGSTSTIGKRVFDLSGKFRVVLGPLTMAEYLGFLPGGDQAKVLHFLIRLRAPDYLEYDVRLELRSAEIPVLTLSNMKTKLGLTTWLGRPKRESTARVVAYA